MLLARPLIISLYHATPESPPRTTNHEPRGTRPPPPAVSMKILEAQSATLTNYEVYTHLLDQERRFALREAAKKKPAPKQAKSKASKEEEEEDDEPRPKALGTVTKEVC